MHIVISGLTIAILPSIPFYIPFLVLFLFDIVLILQAFFIQIFFERVVNGIIFGCLFFILQSCLTLIFNDIASPSVGFFIGISAIPHVAVGLAYKEMMYTDSMNLNIDFSTTFNYYSISTCLISLTLNIVLWTVLVWYFEKVISNNWGSRKHPCFCFDCK